MALEEGTHERWKEFLGSGRGAYIAQSVRLEVLTVRWRLRYLGYLRNGKDAVSQKMQKAHDKILGRRV